MKKREILPVILAAVLLVSILAGCGSETSSSGTSDSSAGTDDSAGGEADAEGTEDSGSAITFESLEVVNNDVCAITVTGIDPDSMWGYSLEVTLENKSEDITYMFSVAYAYINGIYCDPFFASEVSPGNTKDTSIDFGSSTLDEYGVDDYTDICICFEVYDSDDWLAEDEVYTEVHVYPYGEENASMYEREDQEGDIVIVDNDDVKITVIGYEDDSLFSEYEVLLYLENKTDNAVMFSIEEASVNGYAHDPWWADELHAESCEFTSFGWYWSNLEEDGIEEIEEIEFLIKAYDSDTYDETYFEETVTLNP